jgi:hypothetical protein
MVLLFTSWQGSPQNCGRVALYAERRVTAPEHGTYEESNPVRGLVSTARIYLPQDIGNPGASLKSVPSARANLTFGASIWAIRAGSAGRRFFQPICFAVRRFVYQPLCQNAHLSH